jgi:hypothetical protein
LFGKTYTSKNSVFEGLSIKGFADIHEETSAIALSRTDTFTEFIRRERNETLNVLSVQMVMNRRFKDDGT